MSSTRPLVLTNATVIDGRSSRPRPNTALLLRNGYITAMGSAEAIGVPDGAEVMDLTGRWVVPGLIEMHCHIRGGFAHQFVPAGVTTVRNTSGCARELFPFRDAPTDAPTPRVVLAGRLIDGPPGMWPSGANPWICLADSVEEARAEVRAQAAEGVDLIKVYSLLRPEVARAVAEEAAAHGLPADCDIMYATQWDIRDAARMGYRWNEHASGFLQALYPGFNLKDAATHDLIPWEEPDSPELDALCRELVDAGMMLCPTMMLFDQMRSAPDFWWVDTAGARAAKEVIGGQWEQIAANTAAIRRAGRIATFNQAIARAYRRAGGIVVVGTDVPAGIYTAPGLALHREMQILVANGWSPMEALQAATSLAADSMGRSDLGRIQAGARADMVVLTADPLADIRATLAIEHVVKGGRVYEPEEPLQHALSQEEAMAVYHRLMAEFQTLGR